MISKSAPPASALFAESPVPAPAPMIGRPFSISTWSRAMTSRRFTSVFPSSRGLVGDELVQTIRSFYSERGIVDGSFPVDRFDGAGDGFLERLDEGGIGSRVVKRLPLDGNGRKPAVRDHHRDSSRCRSEPLRYSLSYFSVLRRCRSHESHTGVMDVQRPIGELRRHRINGSEVDHVESPEAEHQWYPCAHRCGQAVRTRAEYSTDQFIGEFGRREVEDSRNHAGLDQGFH